MTLVTGTVQDLGYDGMEGTLWARPARFRSDGSVVYAPERKPYKVVGGVVSADLAPGPAVLELQVGSHARGTFEVVIPEADTTLADLLDTVFPWEPAQVSLFVAEREAAQQAASDAEAAAGQAAMAAGQAVTAAGTATAAAQQTGQDRSHVDQVRTELDEAFDESTAGNVLPPRLTEAALKATYASNETMLAPMPHEVLSTIKGTIGTSGAVPIALRFDDWHNNLNAEALPDYMRDRGIVWSLACISRQNIQAWFTSAVTPWSTVQNWVRDGAEIWSHGIDHQTPWNDDPAIFYDNLVEHIVTSKAELEAWNLRVMGFAMPGVPAPGYGSYLLKEDEWKSPAGRLLHATYGLVETDMHAGYRELPSSARYGLAHLTISDGSYNTMPQLQAIVTQAVRTGTGLEMMTHAGNLGSSGKLPLATFKAFLDWLVTERDAGRIEIVTPSSLPFCDPRSTHRPDLLGDNRFADAAATDPLSGGWSGIDGTAVKRVTVSDGPIGRTSSAVRITAPDLPAVIQTPAKLRLNHRNGVGQMLQFKARGVGGAATVKSALRALSPYAGGARSYETALTTGWQTIRIPYTPPISTDVQEVAFSSTSGSVEVTDVHLYIA